MEQLRSFLRLFREFLGELADENAYRRYLRQSGMEASVESWQAFLEIRLGQRYRNPKCC